MITFEKANGETLTVAYSHLYTVRSNNVNAGFWLRFSEDNVEIHGRNLERVADMIRAHRLQILREPIGGVEFDAAGLAVSLEGADINALRETMDKLREIATLKLIGAPDSTIIGLVLQQALLLGGMAYVAAVAIVFSARDVFPRAVVLGPSEVAVMAGVIAVICLLGSLVSIRAALRIEPQQALGG